MLRAVRQLIRDDDKCSSLLDTESLPTCDWKLTMKERSWLQVRISPAQTDPTTALWLQQRALCQINQ